MEWMQEEDGYLMLPINEESSFEVFRSVSDGQWYVQLCLPTSAQAFMLDGVQVHSTNLETVKQTCERHYARIKQEADAILAAANARFASEYDGEWLY